LGIFVFRSWLYVYWITQFLHAFVTHHFPKKHWHWPISYIDLLLKRFVGSNSKLVLFTYIPVPYSVCLGKRLNVFSRLFLFFCWVKQ
jgi:hypothetical protein